MKKMTQGTSQEENNKLEALREFEERHHVKVIEGEIYLPGIDQELMEGKYTKLTEEQLDSLEWAKEFMNRYERKKR